MSVCGNPIQSFIERDQQVQYSLRVQVVMSQAVQVVRLVRVVNKAHNFYMPI